MAKCPKENASHQLAEKAEKLSRSLLSRGDCREDRVLRSRIGNVRSFVTVSVPLLPLPLLDICFPRRVAVDPLLMIFRGSPSTATPYRLPLFLPLFFSGKISRQSVHGFNETPCGCSSINGVTFLVHFAYLDIVGKFFVANFHQLIRELMRAPRNCELAG